VAPGLTRAAWYRSVGGECDGVIQPRTLARSTPPLLSGLRVSRMGASFSECGCDSSEKACLRHLDRCVSRQAYRLWQYNSDDYYPFYHQRETVGTWLLAILSLR
jgi:hypothetical protein